MKFTYSSGQRPLDGYTLKRGIGRGGFGEVYFAVSDGGKEVALKLLTGNNQDVELRGIAQCLNLKHPHLVSLYDLKSDGQSDHWVVMEYIAGETLNVVLNRHPKGLSPELAKQWFVSLAKGVGCLHEHGIVHRDLKPGNIFIEGGTVKVGDYGLSKFISGSQRNAQTQSVGTVHYMAPEISTGNYNKQVDVYAAGIILYEMLTGRVPFDGESAGEILMKHLTTPPDLNLLPREYAAVVGKALAKNPGHRYQTMAEMSRAVEAIGGDALPVLQAALPVPPVVEAKRPTVPPPLPPSPPRADAIPMVLPAQSFRARVGELAGSMAVTPVLAGLFAILFAAVSPFGPTWSLAFFFLTVAVSWAILIPAKFWTAKANESWGRRLVMLGMGLVVGMVAVFLTGWVPQTPLSSVPSLHTVATEQEFNVWNALSTDEVSSAARYLSYFGLAFVLMRWWKVGDRRRPHRFGIFPVLMAAFWGSVLLIVWPWPDPPVGAISLVLGSVIVQLVTPWEQPTPAVKRMRLRYA